MSKLIVMTGPCCVGKSEFVRQMEKRGELEGYVIICPEDYYRTINGDETLRSDRERIWLLLWRDIFFAMEDGKNVLVDANAPTECSRTQYLEWFRGFDERELIYINASFDVLVQNNQKRTERQLSDKELFKQWTDYETPLTDRHFYDWDGYENWKSCGDGSFMFINRR